jgi:predicted ester cyclase
MVGARRRGGTAEEEPMDQPTSSDAAANVAVVRRFYDEVFNDGREGVIDEIIADDYVDYGHNPPGKGPQAARDDWKGVKEPFPDARYEIDDVVAEGDTVAVRWTGTMTHANPFLGVEPTGKRLTLSGTSFYKVTGGKITETRNVADVLGLLAQLGIAPG